MKRTTLFALILLLLPSLSHAQVLTTVYGTGTRGISGIGGPATAAQSGGIICITADKVGNLYFADNFNRVCKISASGILTLVAGNDTSGGESGDGGAATNAALGFPTGIAADDRGNVFIAEGGRIRKVDRSGIITTIAGTPGVFTDSGDGGPATAAKFNQMGEMVMDRNRNIYVATGECLIRKIDSNGIVTTWAGRGLPVDTCGTARGPATAAAVRTRYLGLDTAGNVLVPEIGCSILERITADGIIHTIAGNGSGAWTGEGTAATATGIGFPWGIATNNLDEIYFGDWYWGRIRKINAAGIVYSVVGGGGGAISPDGSLALGASLGGIASFCVTNGSLFFTTFSDRVSLGAHSCNVIRKVDFSTSVKEVTDSAVRCTLYPNPSSGSFTIRFPFELHDTAAVKVYNTTGALVHQTSVTNQEAAIATSLAAGVYTLHIYYSSQHFVGRVEVR